MNADHMPLIGACKPGMEDEEVAFGSSSWDPRLPVGISLGKTWTASWKSWG